MSDTPVFDREDDIRAIEALLRELDPSDLDVVAPPPEIWDRIEAAIEREMPPTNVVSITSRSRFSRVLLAAAAAVVAIAVGAVVVTSIGSDDDVVVANAELTYDPTAFDPLGVDATATAALVERDGGFEIRLDNASLPDPAADDLELWLIAVRDDGSLDVQPVSLVDPEAPGTYAVPTDLDPDVYSIVDISVEPRDGDETHSGRSILRGALADA